MISIQNKLIYSLMILFIFIFEIVLSHKSRWLPHLMHTTAGILDVKYPHNKNIPPR